MVTSSQNPSTYGELITFTANVTAADETTPVGTVQFSLDGTNFGDPVPVGPDGSAESATLASPDPGDHTVIGAFTSAADYSGSGDIITQTVDAAGVDVGLTSSDANSDYGQGVTFTATITSQQVGTGAPSGYAQFVLDGQPLGDAVELDGNGVATSQSVSNLLPGDHEVRVLYSGDAYFVSGASSITQGVAKVVTTTVLTASPTSSTYGQTVTLSATVTPAVGAAGTPGGTVTFKRGTTTIATVPVAAGSGRQRDRGGEREQPARGQPRDPGRVLRHRVVRRQRIAGDDGLGRQAGDDDEGGCGAGQPVAARAARWPSSRPRSPPGEAPSSACRSSSGSAAPSCAPAPRTPRERPDATRCRSSCS